jgi:hypothetical protein
MSGGYDDGYRRCPCFWGKTPGKLVSALADIVPSFHGLRILDAGCGEGKNAVFFAQRGAFVRAIDVSALAARGRSPIFTRRTESPRSDDLGSQRVSD